jgi:hypothetical protein
MRDVAVARDLVGGVDDHPLADAVREDARGFAKERRLADSGRTHEQDALARLDDVADDLERPEDGPSDPVSPTTSPFRFRIAEMRWSVRSTPAHCRS